MDSKSSILSQFIKSESEQIMDIKRHIYKFVGVGSSLLKSLFFKNRSVFYSPNLEIDAKLHKIWYKFIAMLG